MYKVFCKFLISLSIVSFQFDANAQIKVVRGEAAISVQSAFTSLPSVEERAAVMKAAKLTAWRSYLAMPGQNETVDQIRSNDQLFLDRIDELLVDIVVVDENYNKDTKRYMLRIKATVAESVVGSLIRGLSKSTSASNGSGGKTGNGNTLSSSPIMVLGMAREADVVKSFQDKKTSISEIAQDNEASKTKSISSASNRTKEVSGGNIERKRDQISFKIGNVGILNSKLPRILLQNGIKSSPYAFLMKSCQLPDPDSFSKQYASSEVGELPSKVMADIQEKLVRCGKVKYWVFASMEVGGYGTGPNTGMAVVTVTINVQIYEVETGAQVASVSKNLPGRSADQSDAIRMASDSAVQAVSDVITSQIATLQ